MHLERNMRLLGRSKSVYSLLEALYRPPSPKITPHVWKARTIQSSRNQATGKEVVIKFRKDNTAEPRLDFQKEITQTQKVQKHGKTYIRRVLDVIEDPTDNNIDHGMVLEWFPETLWDARENGRLSTFSLAEVRRIMKDALRGIQELHSQGIIHLDTKAQNIVLNGVSAKLCDLGSTWAASPPSVGIAQPMPYRSPEILIGLQWSKEVDIWGWGMVYAHMIQAHINPHIWGIYDRLPEESTAAATQIYENRVRHDIFHDFRLDSIPFYQQCKDRWPQRDPERREVTFRSILGFLEFTECDIQLLERVLDPDPTSRPTAEKTLDDLLILD